MDLLAEQRREREDRILEAARGLIEQVGYEGVTIRSLATASRVSVPTLYKLFGDKDALLMAAVEEQFTNVLFSIERNSGQKGLDLIVELIEGCCKEMLRTAKYSKAVLAVFVRSGQTSEVMQMVGRDLTRELTKALGEMGDARQLVDWVDTTVLAERLAAHQLMVCIEWESGNISAKALTPTMLYGASMMLIAATKGAGQRRLRELVQHEQGNVAVGARARGRAIKR